MGRHIPRHAPRHAAAPASSGVRAGLSGLVGTLRRPVVSASLAAAVLATGAAVATTAQETATAEPRSLAVDTELAQVSAAQATVAAADGARLATARAEVNSAKSALTAKAEEAARAKAAAAAKARKEAAAKAARAAARKALIANAQDDPKAAAKVIMGDYGFGEDQWSCLEQLWHGESGWNYTAENTSSGAYGIPQSLPGSKMGTVADDWRTNPVTQIKWGLGYIKDVYGTPCGAWGAWNSRYPHWY